MKWFTVFLRTAAVMVAVKSAVELIKLVSPAMDTYTLRNVTCCIGKESDIFGFSKFCIVLKCLKNACFWVILVIVFS
jgi:hypothetical protein